MIFFALPTACRVGSQQEQTNLFCRILRGWAPEGSRTQEGRGGCWKQRDYLKQTEQFRPRASPQPSAVKHLTLQKMRASSPGKFSQEDSLDSKASDSRPGGWSVGLNTDGLAIICLLNCLFPEQLHSVTEPRNFPLLHHPSHSPPASLQETGQSSRKTECPREMPVFAHHPSPTEKPHLLALNLQLSSGKNQAPTQERGAKPHRWIQGTQRL